MKYDIFHFYMYMYMYCQHHSDKDSHRLLTKSYFSKRNYIICTWLPVVDGCNMQHICLDHIV